MIESEKNVAAVSKYRAAHNIKRVEIMLRPQEYAELKAAAEAAGQPVASYIKVAIAEKVKKEGEP